MIAGQFLFLGSGGSMGIPVIGCHCAVCTSDSPCNQRLRPSGLITIGSIKLLIDCGPDFRIQALKHHIDRLDGLLITHTHHDHIAGIDELRVYAINHKHPLPCLLSKASAADLKSRYHYIFDELLSSKLKPRITLHYLESDRGTVTFQNINIRYLSYEQAGMQVTGYRIGNFAYISDISHFPDTIYVDLAGVETLVISALRLTPSTFHFSVDQAVTFANRIGAKHTWLMHVSHDLDHEATNALLPPNVRMAYDGLELNFSLEPRDVSSQ